MPPWATESGISQKAPYTACKIGVLILKIATPRSPYFYTQEFTDACAMLQSNLIKGDDADDTETLFLLPYIRLLNHSCEPTVELVASKGGLSWIARTTRTLDRHDEAYSILEQLTVLYSRCLEPRCHYIFFFNR